MERLKLKKITMEIKEKYQVKISNRVVVVENLDNNVYINRARETFRENINTSAKESRSS
jgi:hypothetical protein